MNKEITLACIDNGVKKYQVAERLGITDSTFSKKLRKELSKDEKEKIINIIKKLAKDSEKEVNSNASIYS